MFSKKRRNAIKRHKQNLEQGKDLTDSEQKIGDQAARKSLADFPLLFSLPCLYITGFTALILTTTTTKLTDTNINKIAIAS